MPCPHKNFLSGVARVLGTPEKVKTESMERIFMAADQCAKRFAIAACCEGREPVVPDPFCGSLCIGGGTGSGQECIEKTRGGEGGHRSIARRYRAAKG